MFVRMFALIARSGAPKAAFYHWDPSKDTLVAGLPDDSITTLPRARLEAMVAALPRNY